MHFIAIDLGTTFIKGAVVNLDELCLEHIERRPYPNPVPGLPALFHEVDPLAATSATRELIQVLLAHTPNCAGVVMCSQMHGLVLTNERAEPLSNHISWLDQRILQPRPGGDGTYFDALKSIISDAEAQQLGHELQPSRPLCFLYWLKENGQLPEGNVIPSSLPNFVLANLCGTVPTSDATNASAHGAFNLETLDWHWEIIERLGLSDLQWPQIQPFGEMVGTLRMAGQTLPCYTPVGDHQCALVGAFLRAGELSLNIATGSQVSLVTESLTLGDYQTRPYFDGQFLNTVTGVPAGRALNHLVDLLCEVGRAQGHPADDAWDYIIDATAQVGDTDLAVNLSFFDSVGGASGHIANISEANLTVGHLFRAAFQSMADNYYASALNLSPHAAWTTLVFSGGLAQKMDVLRQLTQARFQTTARLCVAAEDALLGLLVLAMVSDGRAASVQEAIDSVSSTN